MKKLAKPTLMKIIGVSIIIFTYVMASPYKASENEKNSLAGSFEFEEHRIKKIPGVEKKIRKVHPQYTEIVGWLSAAGAAVSIGDLDNDGYSSEFVYVDPRFDKVIIEDFLNNDKTNKPRILEVKTLRYNEKTMAPQGTLVDDFNLDGLTDVLVYYWGRTPIIFLADKAGDYSEVELIDNQERWFTLTATLSDFDGDGNTDILITNYFPDGSRLLDEKATDRNQTMQHSMSRAFNGGSNHFFLFDKINGGVPSFKPDFNWDKSINNPNDWTLAVGAIDLTGDALPEIYFANDFGPDKLLFNQSVPGKLIFIEVKGERNFNTPSSSVLGKDSFKGMGVGFGDINNDGLFDIYVSNIADEFALMETHFAFINNGTMDAFSKGIAPFKNESEQLGLSRSSWGWDSKLADFNNDGENEAVQATGFLKGEIDRWPELQELAIGNDELLSNISSWPKLGVGDDLSGHNHNPFFTKNKNGRFVDIAEKLGLNRNQVTRGIAIGDLDYDGDLDFICANQWEDSFVFENKYKGINSFVGLRIYASLEPIESTILNPTNDIKKKYAIGAVVKLFDAENEKLLGIGYVDGGTGHSGSNSKDVFFGLNKIDKNKVLRAEISYRNRKSIMKTENVKLTQGWNSIVLAH